MLAGVLLASALALLAKVGGFLALVAVGWANRSRLVPLAGRRWRP